MEGGREGLTGGGWGVAACCCCRFAVEQGGERGLVPPLVEPTDFRAVSGKGEAAGQGGEKGWVRLAD